MTESSAPTLSPTLFQPQFSTHQVCANCKFWQNQMCHRNPPTTDCETTAFPRTKPEDWCGEHAFQTKVQDQLVVKQTYNLP